MKSGFVAVVGRTNVGKSSIVNALVGQKVSITGPKAQTTRNKILGIKHLPSAQIVFVDTPGTIHQKGALASYLSQSIKSGMQGADVILAVVDGNRLNENDVSSLKKLCEGSVPVVLAVNKMDLFTFEKVYPRLKELGLLKVAAIVNVSAKTGENLDKLEEEIVRLLPEGIPYFDEDQVTDKSERFMASELVREKALLYLQEEVPHGMAVDVSEFVEEENIVKIAVDLVVLEKRHKPIVIGKNGEMLKKIASSARAEMEKLFQKKVYLSCFVKVEENWTEDKMQLKSMGYDINNL